MLLLYFWGHFLLFVICALSTGSPIFLPQTFFNSLLTLFFSYPLRLLPAPNRTLIPLLPLNPPPLILLLPTSYPSFLFFFFKKIY
ncbi:MAG: hypothetical protein COY40_04405 [Alphaproteobacteria bacterium CG_4_10_14_0_8_um_filter_53_9]|nr:MAG: hypothetical protein COY40_04405 [Alphaproteobacteria bacterium CG_4_10_14_0_8_um_filter_53_9]